MVEEAEDLRIAFDRTGEHSGPPVDTGELMLRVKNRLRRHEGWVNHMYRDSYEGKVTVGVSGFCCRGPRLGSIPGVPRTSPSEPCRWQSLWLIGTKYLGYPSGRTKKAATFDRPTKVELSDATIGFVLAKKLLTLRDDLKTAFSNSGIDFDNLPPAVLEAMLDLAWNVKYFQDPTVFSNMKAALKAEDWDTAADESHRAPPVAESRNIEIRNLILQADLQRMW